MTPITTRQTWFSSNRLALGGLLLLALVVRGGVLGALRDNLKQDPDAYREIAENLLRHGEFALGKGEPEGGRQPFHPTAYRPPLYPVLLSNLPTADGRQVSLAKVAILHLALGVATVWLTWLTARRVGCAHQMGTGLGTAVGTAHPTMAGLIVAFDPILLNQQTLVMTETLAAFLAILSLWCLARFNVERSWFNAGLAGGAIGLAVLSRPTFLPWLGMVGAGMLLVRGGLDIRIQNSEFRIPKPDQTTARRWFSGFGWRLANLAALGIVAAGVISPWVIRNYRTFGRVEIRDARTKLPIAFTPLRDRIIVTTTHGGYTLRLGNNPQFYKWLRMSNDGLPWNDSEFEAAEGEAIRLMSPGWPLESYWDDWFRRRAVGTIRTQPYDFLRAVFYRLRQLWSPLPHKLTADESTSRRLLRYATCIWYCGVYVLLAVGVWRLRWKLLAPPWVWGVLLCLAFTAVHTLYWSNLRMRAPLMPFVAIVAAQGIVVSRQR